MISKSKITPFLKTHTFFVASMLIGALYFLFLTVVIDKTGGDYISFLREPLRVTFGIERWFNWSSRLFIEDAVDIFTKSIVIWQILTVFSGAILFWCIGRILNFQKIWQAVLIGCLFLFTNLYILTTAGIIPTTINYLWPMACLVFVVTMLVRPFRTSKLRRVASIVSVPLFIFAVCNEQIALLAVIFGIATVAYMLYTKYPVPKIVWVYIAIAIIGVVNALISPGNAYRAASETVSWWPGFNDISLVSKVAIGIITTFSRLLFAPEMMAIIFIVALVVYAYKVRNLRGFISLLPAVSLLILFFFPKRGAGEHPAIVMPNFFHDLRETAMTIDPSHLVSQRMTAVYIALFFVMVCSILVSIWFLFGKTKRTYFTLVLFGSGLAVSVAVSLSPTLFASGTRTLYPLTVILVVINAKIIADIINLHFSNTQKIRRK